MKKPLLPLFRLIVILLCLLQADLPAQTLEWVKQLGGIAEDNVSDMEVDKDGNIFVTGTFDYIADFDPGPNEFLLTSKGLSDVFIAKYDSLGNFIWANQFGSSLDDGGVLELELDSTGVVYMLYSLLNSLSKGASLYSTKGQDFDFSLFDGFNSFVMKFSNIGEIVEMQQSYFRIRSIRFDSKGLLYYKAWFYAGASTGNALYGSSLNAIWNVLVPSTGEYIVKLEDFSKLVWFVKIGDGSTNGYTDNSNSIKCDNDGNLYIWSLFSKTMDLQINDTIRTFIALGSNANSSDVLISKIGSTGKLLWSKQLSGVDNGNDFELDSLNNVVICGNYYKRVIYEPGGSKDFLIAQKNISWGVFLCKISDVGDLLLLKNGDYSLSSTTIKIVYDKILVAPTQYRNSKFSLLSLDFELLRTYSVASNTGVTQDCYVGHVSLAHNQIIALGVFSKIIDFDPSCKEYNISSFINSQDIFLLNINLNQIDSTVYKITGTKSICLGDSLPLSFPPNLKYAWSTGENNNAITVKPNKVGVSKYSVTVENAVGCIFKDSVSITVLAAPQLVGGGDQSICLGQSTQLLATGATSYAWSTGQADSSIVVQPLVSTMYTLTLTNANGCIAVDTILVKVNDLPKANAGADQSICLGDSAVLAASGGTQYYWNNLKLQAKQIVKPTTTTNYSVVVTDVNGCAATDEVVVNVYPNPDVDLLGIDTLKLKVGQFVILYAGKGQKFLWNTGDTANTIIIDQKSGSYCVTVTSAFGCQGSDCLFVQFTPTANLEVGASTVNIYPNPAQDFLTIAVKNSAVLPYDLQLFNALGQSVKVINHNTVDQQNIDISDLTAGNYFVHLRFEGYTVVEQVVVRRQ